MIHPVDHRNSDGPPLLLNARDAAKALGICERTLWSLTEPRGGIPCVRFGRAVRYAPHDLQAWIDRQKGVDQ